MVELTDNMNKVPKEHSPIECQAREDQTQREINQHFGAHARQFLNGFHTDVVQEVKTAIAEYSVVVVGMSVNTPVKRVRKALTDAGVDYHYLEYGGYFSKWKERLAIKLWSGWPTYPQVFVNGQLIGGNECTRSALADGSFQQLLEASKNS